MAMICVNGARECNGCMHCQDVVEGMALCEYCEEPIYENDDHYDIDGIKIHWDCLRDWAEQYRK